MKHVVLIVCGLQMLGMVSAQFLNIFSSLMNTGSGSSKNGSKCASTSCMPWCQRKMDSNGCLSCQCSNAGGSPMAGISHMGGMNPMGSGMSPMGSGISPMGSGMSPMGSGRSPMGTGINPISGMNPMTSMFSGLTGGASPMTGHVQAQGVGTSCDPAPTTCPVPQPWCERIVGNDKCVKCICGQELMSYLQTLNGQTTLKSTTVTDTTTTTTKAAKTTTPTTTHAPTPPTTTVSCLVNFYCTKLCDRGYKTDDRGCPVCECITGVLVDIPVVATDPLGKIFNRPSTAHALIVTSHVTSCPGIFDCALICDNGYESDGIGCPLCKCVV